ncbi:MAG TPA: hypothetical protein VLE49_13155, partial [Anaerolineales bacterium]|nr:hypothetical protein [Anaerolineales bacterium]
YSNLMFALLIAVLVVALVLLYILVFKKWWGADLDETETPRLVKDFAWLGALIILCAVVPVILSDRQVELYDAYKSYGLHPIPGVILFVVGIVLMFQPKFRRRILIALILISVTTQLLNADYWKQYWETQRSMWWQMTWRAPDIQDDTLVMAYSAGFNPQQDYEIWGPLNLIYNPDPAQVPAIQAEVLNFDTSYSILRGEVLNNYVRDIKLHRDFNNVLLLTVSSSSSCIHVLDGRLPVYSAREPLLVQQVGKYSHIDRIIPTGTAPVPPSSIFGSEPEHGWCYYYQKASLARQNGDWEEVSKIYDQARKLDLETRDKSEMMPFFEALVNLGRVEDAKALFTKEIKGQSEMRLQLCTSLAKDPGYPPEFRYDYKTIREMLCGS